MSPAGFPHSDTPGSSLACSSPRLFAACHVLPRRSVPRHPPCALLRLTDHVPPPRSRTTRSLRSPAFLPPDNETARRPRSKMTSRPGFPSTSPDQAHVGPPFPHFQTTYSSLLRLRMHAPTSTGRPNAHAHLRLTSPLYPIRSPEPRSPNTTRSRPGVASVK